MIRTGIPVLDEQLKGGIPIGKTFAFYIAPGINGDVFTFQTVYANLAENGVCYFLTSNSSPDVARASFREYGWDLTPHAARFAVSHEFYYPLKYKYATIIQTSTAADASTSPGVQLIRVRRLSSAVCVANVRLSILL